MKASPSTWYGSVVLDECKRLRKSIVPISEEYYGPIDKLFGHNTLYPFALLLGNHSSGKSSFINYMLGRKTQATGVAPTDDNFTIIAPGEEDFDRNGPALIGDPDLGFCDLKVFGPTLVNHTQLKVRSGISIKNFMIVDSPGMIDSPGTRNQDTAMDRGYDFASVCRWYAERADVILLFFDPDKPGTTGETLSILTNSLVGLDHKLFIILNKADQFYKIHDFARAYGSLCWNLSKVISRKDLPRIYTMCLPSDYVNEENNKRMVNGETNERNLTTPIADTIEYKEPHDLLKSPSLFYKQGFLDLEESRNEVIKEVFNAPRRRVDNEISRLFESVSALFMHCRIVDEITREYNAKLWKARIKQAAFYAAWFGITYGLNLLCGWIESYEARHPRPHPAAHHPNHHNHHAAAHTTKNLNKAASNTTTTPAISKPAAPSAVPTQATSSVPSAPSTPSSAVAVTPASTEPTRFQMFFDYIGDFLSQFTFRQITVASSITLGMISSSFYSYWENLQMMKYLQSFEKRSTYEHMFHQIYSKELQSHDQFHLSLGIIVIDQLMNNISPALIPMLKYVKKDDLKSLQRILNEDIAELRRRASPNFPMIESNPVQNIQHHQKQQPQQYQQLERNNSSNDVHSAASSPFHVYYGSPKPINNTSQQNDPQSNNKTKIIDDKELLTEKEFQEFHADDSMMGGNESSHYMLKNYDHYTINPIQIKSQDIPDIEMKEFVFRNTSKETTNNNTSNHHKETDAMSEDDK